MPNLCGCFSCGPILANHRSIERTLRSHLALERIARRKIKKPMTFAISTVNTIFILNRSGSAALTMGTTERHINSSTTNPADSAHSLMFMLARSRISCAPNSGTANIAKYVTA